ncbi:hypothetical protein OT109_16905 [Phycisphaeraceae bacterium D3-23]
MNQLFKEDDAGYRFVSNRTLVGAFGVFVLFLAGLGVLLAMRQSDVARGEDFLFFGAILVLFLVIGFTLIYVAWRGRIPIWVQSVMQIDSEGNEVPTGDPTLDKEISVFWPISLILLAFAGSILVYVFVL